MGWWGVRKGSAHVWRCVPPVTACTVGPPFTQPAVAAGRPLAKCAVLIPCDQKPAPSYLLGIGAVVRWLHLLQGRGGPHQNLR